MWRRAAGAFAGFGRPSSARPERCGGPATSGAEADEQILSIRDLTVDLSLRGRQVPVLEGVSLNVNRGAVLALAGESGSGKTLLGLAVSGLLPDVARVGRGSIKLRGAELVNLPPRRRRALNGAAIGTVFQEPMTALNPVTRVGRQLCEVPLLHGFSDAESTARALELLAAMGIQDPARVMRAFPHELSGGLRQRIVIAMALILSPPLVVADEPTTALDVTVQRMILDRLRVLAARSGTALLLITHDLGVVAEMADEVAILYAGRVVERAPVADLFGRPAHPYTQGLLAARPRWPDPVHAGARPALRAMPGRVPQPGEVLRGCAFAARCGRADARCRTERPPFDTAGVAARRRVACWRPLPVDGPELERYR